MNLSPQGYIITKDPINKNPFWEGDTPEAKALVQSLVPIREEAFISNLNQYTPEYEDYYNTQVNCNNAWSEDQYTFYGYGILNSYSIRNNTKDVTKIIYDYLDAIKNNEDVNAIRIHEVTWWKLYDLWNEQDNSWKFTDPDELALYNSLGTSEPPSNFKVLDSLFKYEDSSTPTTVERWVHVLTPFISDLEETTYLDYTSINTITEAE